MWKCKALSLLLSLLIVALSGCGVKDTAPVADSTDGDSGTEMVEDASSPSREAQDLAFADISEIEEPEYFATENLDAFFSDIKTWKVLDEESNIGYFSIGVMKDDVDAASLSVQLITAMLNDPEISEMDIPLESASCGGYFMIAGTQDSAAVIDKFSEVVSTTPVSTIDDIFAALGFQNA